VGRGNRWLLLTPLIFPSRQSHRFFRNQNISNLRFRRQKKSEEQTADFWSHRAHFGHRNTPLKTGRKQSFKPDINPRGDADADLMPRKLAAASLAKRSRETTFPYRQLGEYRVQSKLLGKEKLGENKREVSSGLEAILAVVGTSPTGAGIPRLWVLQPPTPNTREVGTRGSGQFKHPWSRGIFDVPCLLLDLLDVIIKSHGCRNGRWGKIPRHSHTARCLTTIEGRWLKRGNKTSRPTHGHKNIRKLKYFTQNAPG